MVAILEVVTVCDVDGNVKVFGSLLLEFNERRYESS
jgi:hypothetical protein